MATVDRQGRRWSDVALLGLLAANGLFILYIVWTRLNFIQIDQAGHIASGVTFGHGGYHELNDQAFLGYVHGLFYPPLEDAVLASLNWITGDRYVVAYKLYLTLLVVAYLCAVARLGWWFQRRIVRAFVLVSFLFLLDIEKPALLQYQGLSFVDLWLTGLSSEVLGGVFLLLLVREWLGACRARWLGAFLLAAVLSHLVVGFVAMMLVGVALVQTRQRALAIAIAVSVGASAFFWIPFAINRSFMTSSNILVMKPFVFAGAAIVGVALGVRQLHARTLFLVALALVLPMLIGPVLDAHGIAYPKFHYYRFGIIALFFLITGYGVLIEKPREAHWHRRIVHVVTAGLVVVGLVQFRLQRFDFAWPSLRPAQMQVINPAALELPEYGRFWVVGNSRTSDFGIDSYLAATYPSFRSTKGLFWESYRHNVLLSSWLATLLSPPVVLDYYYHYGFSCLVNQCLMDQFFHDFNVKGWIIDETVPLHHVSDTRRACYREIVKRGGTPSYDLVRKGLLSDASGGYSVFWLSPRGSPLSNDVIEPVPRSRLTPFDASKKEYFADAIRSAMGTCERGEPGRTFVEQGALTRLRSRLGAETSNARPRMSFTKRTSNTFEIVVDSPAPVLFAIKLAYLPGVELVGPDGPIPLYEAMAGMIAYGHGHMTLRYTRPPGVLLGYLVSLLTALSVVIAMVWSRRRRGRM